MQWDRVNGQLAMSRALGDFTYKMNSSLSASEQLVIAYPDISVRPRQPESDQVLVLACDGVWDVIKNKQAVDIVTSVLSNAPTDMFKTKRAKIDPELDEKKSAQPSAQDLADVLVTAALNRESTDNISAIIVKFPAVLT